jgi:hypothetical protein
MRAKFSAVAEIHKIRESQDNPHIYSAGSYCIEVLATEERR